MASISDSPAPTADEAATRAGEHGATSLLMEEHTRFRIESANVLAEDLDDEIVLLHLASGNYYSLAGTGADVWRLAVAGCSLGTISDNLHSDGAPERAARVAAVSSFLRDLVADSLLDISDPDHAAPPAAVPASVSSWSLPVLGKYTDMQDLLLLDPIHEVDEAGWPARRDPGPGD